MPNKIIRDLFTGEFREVPFEGSGVIARIPSPGAVKRSYSTGSGWPIHSENAAVDVADIPRTQQLLKEKGVKTEFDKLGRPVWTSQAHKKAHCEALGYYDRNGGYSDPQPQDFNPSDFTQERQVQEFAKMLAELSETF